MRLMPEDERCYELLARLGRRLVDATALLEQLIAAPEREHELAERIADVVRAADATRHDLATRIDRVSVTPLDPDDMQHLATRLDRVVHLVGDAARRADAYRLPTFPGAAGRLGGILAHASDELAAGVSALRRPVDVVPAVHAVKALEEEADAVYREAIGSLFRSTADALEIIKMKDVYDILEGAVDECDRASRVLESIAVRHA